MVYVKHFRIINDEHYIDGVKVEHEKFFDEKKNVKGAYNFEILKNCSERVKNLYIEGDKNNAELHNPENWIKLDIEVIKSKFKGLQDYLNPNF